LDQPMARPVRTLLLASRVVAVSWVFAPICRVEVVGETDTLATATGAGALTVREADAVFPSLDALIAAVPGATVETSPVLLTVATAVFPLAQV